MSAAKQERHQDVVGFTFCSDLPEVSQVLRGAAEFARDNGENPVALTIVLRELLTNAVVHGNRNDRNRNVMVELECRDEGGLRLTVEDEGEGFDYRSLDLKLPEGCGRIRDRGYKLVNAYCDKIEFAAPGNRVTAYLKSANHHTP